MDFKILDWDSGFFGFKVARIVSPDLSVKELEAVLAVLRERQVTLVYWATERPLETSDAARLQGYLVDTKTTFSIDFRRHPGDDLAPTEDVKPCTQTMPGSDFERLAIQSGEYSRFAVDPRIGRDKFEALYKTWVTRSLRKEIAQEVLAIQDDNRVVAMITLGAKDGKGEIGLLAVDAEFRGRNNGQKLLRAARQWFLQNGCTFAQVVTQGTNVPACRLYEKYGYTRERVQYFYHFWLTPAV